MNGATRLVIVVCWLGWGAYWLIAAFATKRTVERGGVVAYRVVCVMLIVAVLGAFRLAGAAPGSELWRTSLALGVVSDCVVVGAAFAIWARIVLGRNWSAEVTFKQGHELIESGPYGLVRHPIYTGLLAMVLGTALDFGRPIAVAVFVGLCGALWWRAREEEDIMSRHFPAAYAGYKARVHAIIPFLL